MKGLYKAVILLLTLTCSGLSVAHVDVDLRVQHYDYLLNSQTNDAHLYLKRGELHSDNRHWDLAWRDFQTALKYTHDDKLRLDIWFYMGRMRLQSGMPDEAKTLLSKVIKLDPRYKSARLNLARTYSALEEYEQAVDEMDIFMSLLNRPTPDQFIERAMMAKSIESEGISKAIDGLNDGIDRLGPMVSLIDLLVDTYQELGETQLALAAIELLPDDVEALPRWQLRKGEILHRLMRYGDAQTAYQNGLNTISTMPAHRQSMPAVQALKNRLEGKLIY
ncbi:tetratricopeptide repeat protein [Shewanella atlantica]|uniref:Tetratricopeptide repeat protein n=1 Tax=Shewanella atlantica TaxID=271099 RepID=A0A431WFQ0_9GAMM|nr:tetratricopeptide repeat protein [Shewanella atlantica]RTR34141.1 tetratricopeptide repeat protein [Shewanella atlantica]